MNNTEEFEGTDKGPMDRRKRISFDRTVWAMWWAGTALILLSWINVVSNTVGWIGFAAALASSMASMVANKYWRMPGK